MSSLKSSSVSRRGRGGTNNKSKKVEEYDESNPIIINFRKYAAELDDKHDRYERIVKISRDVTIESKRIIFLLHTIDAKKGNTEKVLQEAEKRLYAIFENSFLPIAKELENMDAYQYCRSYSAGLQEFIEAFSFFELLSDKELSDWEIIQKNLSFTVEESNDEEKTEDSQNNDAVAEDPKKLNISCLVQPSEYMLGLADVTGEIMRRCINSLGCGDIDVCFECCRILQDFYKGYVGLDTYRHRELSRKIFTLRQSVLKTEQVCYNVKVRGSEAALCGSGNAYLSFVGDKVEDVDEGFY